MAKKTKSRQMADDIMQGMEEIRSMIRDGARPEDRFIVHHVSLPDPGKQAESPTVGVDSFLEEHGHSGRTNTPRQLCARASRCGRLL